MWKVGDVEPVRVMGAEGYPYGFNVCTEDGKPVVSFAYASRALAEAAATHLESALLNAISVRPHPSLLADGVSGLWCECNTRTKSAAYAMFGNGARTVFLQRVIPASTLGPESRT